MLCTTNVLNATSDHRILALHYILCCIAISHTKKLSNIRMTGIIITLVWNVKFNNLRVNASAKYTHKTKCYHNRNE